MFDVTKGNRLHIAIFGKRNAGKSSLINALTGQNLAIVSDVAGTTTDPVYKSMEILPIGPVMLIDTAGIDDSGELGRLRVQKSLEVLRKTEIAILVVAVDSKFDSSEQLVIEQCKKLTIPLIIVVNKIDTGAVANNLIPAEYADLPVAFLSSLTGNGINTLKRLLIKHAPSKWEQQTLVGDLINPGDVCVLVTPIDLAAPKGRLILPQVQIIRDILDSDALAYVVKERELRACIQSLKAKPRIVITDSQAFLKADADTPPGVLFTSFSILFARFKGDLRTFVEGASVLGRLRSGDKVLIAESCTHHRVEDDIGTVKIPRWIRNMQGDVQFEHVAGTEFPDNLSEYKLVLHCGGCMSNRRDMLSRMLVCKEAGVPIVNYGIAIGYLQGVLKRALSPWPELQEIIDV
ncbi:MAG: [FeFe] hydrogenase H-cluster maturation GTPase HydF [Negativicutes bacterium]|jgi:[FeFe] hydrogenase H-cluster maturation GTPase HydF